MTAKRPLLRLRTPIDLLAAAPYLLGFHPTESVVVLGLRARHVVFHVRADLPPHDTPAGESVEYARHLADLFVRNSARQVLIIGYGPEEDVTGVVLPIRDAMTARRVEVTEILRAADGRYWSYLCESAQCCPPQGTPYDVSTSRIAAEATLAGRVALTDREALERQLAPPAGPALDAIAEATAAAQQRFAELLDRAGAARASAAVRSAGDQALTAAYDRAMAGGALTDDEVAWLTVLLTWAEVRDNADRYTSGEPSSDARRVAMWTDLVRRADPTLAAAPAGLLAYTAWQAGEGAIAGLAVDRALDADPANSLALLMAEVLRRGIPPSVATAGSPGPRPGRRARRRAGGERVS